MMMPATQHATRRHGGYTPHTHTHTHTHTHKRKRGGPNKRSPFISLKSYPTVPLVTLVIRVQEFRDLSLVLCIEKGGANGGSR
jgi:hypothetical protein